MSKKSVPCMSRDDIEIEILGKKYGRWIYDYEWRGLFPLLRYSCKGKDMVIIDVVNDELEGMKEFYSGTEVYWDDKLSSYVLERK